MKRPQSPFPKEVYERNAEIYKLMANPKRLEILNILSKNNATLSELTEIIGATKVNISQHLSVLKHLRLVTVIKRSKEVYYSIVNPEIVNSCEILRNL
jgi:ArsR family transcriptional regulator